MKSITGVLITLKPEIASDIQGESLWSKNAPSLAELGACILAITVKALSPPAK
jgi:hypothetical protein